jgi:hypothetical protein
MAVPKPSFYDARLSNLKGQPENDKPIEALTWNQSRCSSARQRERERPCFHRWWPWQWRRWRGSYREHCGEIGDNEYQLRMCLYVETSRLYTHRYSFCHNPEMPQLADAHGPKSRPLGAHLDSPSSDNVRHFDRGCGESISGF